MATPHSVYTAKLKNFKAELKQVKRKLLQSSMLRLAVFLLIVLAVYILWENWQFIGISVTVGFILFFFLVSRHANLKQNKQRLIALIAINETELKVLKGDFSEMPTGEKYINPLHVFSQDIDLFGEDSFFQYANRTALPEGEQFLADLFLENSTANIPEKQEAVKELAKQVNFRQEFSARAEMTNQTEDEEFAKHHHRLEQLKKHKKFTPKSAKIISTVFSVISTGFILSYFVGLIPAFWVLLWLCVGLIITGIYVKKVNLLSHYVSSMQKTFSQYHILLKLLENTAFSSKILQQNQQRILTEEKNASQILKEFSKAIDALDQRGNLLFGFLGNGFLLWDMRQSARLEKWIENYVDKAEEWFKVIAEVDAYNSLGNFWFNHPHYTFPEISKGNFVIEAKNAVHPLIPENEAVTNDYLIKKEEFFIITGANMAGKSTFLRTVALQIVMSNIGLPVCAKTVKYNPIKLITSMRTVDSLAEEASYFYAELSRLKFIIDRLKTGHYFIILDEILKGTNSTDKAIGSRKFLEKLVRLHSTGIIATHDLSLCKVAESLPQVDNYYFDAQIINDELLFDYKFKKGVCQNMNASFLLKKMEIVDD